MLVPIIGVQTLKDHKKKTEHSHVGCQSCSVVVMLYSQAL